MKKFLVVLLALVMVFAFATTAMAADTQIPDYNDLKDVDAELQIAIYRLSALGVLEGSAGWGNAYRPAENLTRAEFAKIAIYLTGNEDKVDLYAKQAPAFADVPNGFWAQGYINACYDLGLMKGRTVSAPLIFDPQGMVTYQEVATVVLRALGYNDNLKGEWPNDYSRKAGEVGIIKWVDYAGPQPINRADMASIANEALDLYMVSYVQNEIAQGLGYVLSGNVDADGFAPFIYYTNEKLGTRQADQVTYMIEYAFGAEVVDAQFYDGWKYVGDSEVGSPLYSEASGWGYDNFKDEELLFIFGQIEENTYGRRDKNTEYYFDNESYSYEVATNYYIWKADLVDLGNQQATLTIVDDEVVFVELTSDIVRAHEVESKNGGKDIKADGTTYKYIGKDYSEKAAKDVTEFVDCFGDYDLEYGEVFLNDDGDAYDYKDYSLFEDVDYEVFEDIDDTYINFLSGHREKISKLGDYKVWKFDEGFIEIDDLEYGDVVYKTQQLEGKVDLYLVFAAQTGDLTKASSDGVTIDDFKYGFLLEGTHAYSFYSYDNGKTFEPYTPVSYNLLGDEFFDEDVSYAVAYAFNNFVYFSVDAYNYTYGVVYDYDYRIASTQDIVVTGLKLHFADGTEKTYPLSQELRDEYNAPNKGSLIRFRIESGEIIWWFYREDGADISRSSSSSKTNTNAYLDYDGNGKVEVDVDKDNRIIEFEGIEYELAANAEVFLISTKWHGGDIVFDGVEVITAEKLLKNGDFTAYQVAAAFLKSPSGNLVKTLYVVGHEYGSTYNIGFVTGLRGTTGSGNYYAEIDGKEFAVSSKISDTGFMGLLFKGAMIAYSSNANDVIIDYVVLVDADGDLRPVSALSADPTWFDGTYYDGVLESFNLNDGDEYYVLDALTYTAFTENNLQVSGDTYYLRNFKGGMFNGDYYVNSSDDDLDDFVTDVNKVNNGSTNDLDAFWAFYRSGSTNQIHYLFAK